MKVVAEALHRCSKERGWGGRVLKQTMLPGGRRQPQREGAKNKTWKRQRLRLRMWQWSVSYHAPTPGCGLKKHISDREERCARWLKINLPNLRFENTYIRKLC
ncbi:hypothetical protein TNCV_2948491 [Trichonephila clavipes]|nr:hypothetical protein TNCV_2948491 [Trichonephila clavipes]